ncbi:hypothetical protein D9757_004009 [Collybiopsis confluens]|uniref:Uncharacterized protein n=1 Tax=Collybiopsis confluens TaxID=2823264 RepID=A0A8H5MEJ8_9AGAR|nr:hypothetical protein D9757_004009 [Collybiopsis confluens]
MSKLVGEITLYGSTLNQARFTTLVTLSVLSERMPSPITLIVHIQYSLPKARAMLNHDAPLRYEKLRSDLSSLKLPHPPMANLAEPTEDGIAFYWETTRFSPLWNAIEYSIRALARRGQGQGQSQTRGQGQSLHSEELLAAMIDADMVCNSERVWKEELRGHTLDPFSRKYGPRIFNSRQSRSRIRSRSRPPLSSGQKKVLDRVHRSPPPRRPSSEYRKRRWEGSRSPRRTPSFSSSMSSSNASISGTLQRIESVQTALFEIQNSHKLMDQEIELAQFDLGQEVDKGEEEKLESVGLPPAHPSLPSIPTGYATSPPLNPAFPHDSLRPSPPQIPDAKFWETRDPSPSILLGTPNSEELQSNSFNKIMVLPAEVSAYPETGSVFTEGHLDDLSRENRIDFGGLSGSRSRDNPNYNATRISELTREFWDTGRRISAISAKCLSVEKQILAKVGRIQNELLEKLNEAQRTLVHQRKSRESAEAILGDVLRECKNPMVVPALLAALVCTELDAEEEAMDCGT